MTKSQMDVIDFGFQDFLSLTLGSSRIQEWTHLSLDCWVRALHQTKPVYRLHPLVSCICRWVREFLNEENKGLDVLVDYLSFAQCSVM